MPELHTHHPDSAPTPGPQTRRLGALVGRWRDVMVGEQKVRAVELIGEYDPATGSFTGRAYDNLGNVTVMRAGVDERGVWTFTGGGDVAAVARPSSADVSGAVRSTLTVNADRSRMTARWERSDDGAGWQPWMDMTFTRMP